MVFCLDIAVKSLWTIT